jgi:uncharacterized membrane protein YccC
MGPSQAPPRRSEEALDALAALSRQGMRERLHRLRRTALPIVQCAVGAALAWLIATSPPIDHDQPFFAPIAALISIGVGFGQRLPRVVELVAGVAVGVLVGDLLVAWIGTGVVQIVLIVGLAMAAAVILGGGSVIVTQAGASAVLVATLTAPASSGISLDRFVDTLVGGVVGVVVSVVLLPVNPVRTARRQIDPVLATLAELIDDCAKALIDGDRAGAAATCESWSGTSSRCFGAESRYHRHCRKRCARLPERSACSASNSPATTTPMNAGRRRSLPPNSPPRRWTKPGASPARSWSPRSVRSPSTCCARPGWIAK